MQITVPHHIHTTPSPQGVCLQLCKPKLPISLPPPSLQMPGARCRDYCRKTCNCQNAVCAQYTCGYLSHFNSWEWILDGVRVERIHFKWHIKMFSFRLRCLLLAGRIAHSIKDVLLHLDTSLAISASQALLASTAGSSWL